MLDRHAAISGSNSQALLTLIEHGQTIRSVIRSVLGDNVAIDRSLLVASMLEHLSEHQVVVVSGTAGSGKSALVKNALNQLESVRPILVFKAEEFATAHINETLAKTQTSLNAQRLFALLAAQDRKIIMIESIERLLEHSVRDAFSHLLQLAHQDQSIQLVLTCRDYSLETVRSSLLVPAGLSHTVLEVPALSDEELRQVEMEISNLVPPLHDTRLRSLLRTPYLLDMAARLDWTIDPLPQNERAFREKCWRELIRAEPFSARGMPERRKQMFLDIARCRAMQLRPYVAPERADPEALDSLRNDGLIIASRTSSSLVAPAHDVLEDWAIMHWLEERFVLADDPHSVLAESVGGFPAVRRGYRRWLSEWFETHTDSARKFVLDTLDHAQLPAFFRDDSLVCALLSENAELFIEHCQNRLFADESGLLTQVVHILRVACKESPRWLTVPGPPSQIMVPKGAGWAVTLRVVADTLEHLVPQHTNLLLGLIEDWARQVDGQNPSPPGSEAAGKIAVALLPHFEDYRTDDALKRTLEVLLKVPSSVAPEFTALMERARTRNHRDSTAQVLAKLVLGSSSSVYACRDFPTEVIDLMNVRVRMTEADPENMRRRFSSDVDQMFGLRRHEVSAFFPASTLQGPFRALLQFHPQTAIAFIIDLLNHAGEWYGTQDRPGQHLEPAWQTTLKIPEEESIHQWMNPRLYYLFRGMSDGPYVLQSTLMALETWLHAVGKRDDVDLESWLLHILRESNNVMVTGVVASVCIAYPEKAGRAGLTLLSNRDLIQCDHHRCDLEPTVGWLPQSGLKVDHYLYEQERRDSNALEHRRQDLEALAIRMQLTEHRHAVWQIIDRHRTELPSNQDENTRVWRLALHRMDIRDYQPMEIPEEVFEDDSEPSAERVYFGPGDVEPDIQNMIDERTAAHAVVERHMRLQHFSRLAWEDRSSEETIDWQALLDEAQTIEADIGEPEDHLRSGPGLIAAVCIRDHLDELDEQQFQWCKQRIEFELRRNSEAPDDMTRAALGMLQPDRAAASVIPLLLSRQEVPYDVELLSLLALALTHPVQEVSACTSDGVGFYMGASHKALALCCAAAAAYRARLIMDFRAQQSALPYDERVSFNELIDRVAPIVREAIEKGTLSFETELSAVDPDDGSGAEATGTILKILAYCPEWDESKVFYARIASWLVSTWDRGRLSHRSGARNFELEHDARGHIARFVLMLPHKEAIRLCEPILDAVSRHPRETADFVYEFVSSADKGSDDCFWVLWQKFAERALNAPWCDRLDQEHPSGEPFVNAIFLTYGWHKHVTHWPRLEGNAHRFDELAQRFPAVGLCLRSYLKFLYTIGQQSLPAAFTIIDSILDRGEPVVMVSHSDAAFYLEVLLRRYIYAEPYRLKSDNKLRKSVLKILDVLVAGESSAAYLMRDDFVTPLGVMS